MSPAAAPLASSCSTPRRRPPPAAAPLLLGCCALLLCTAALVRRVQGAANALKQALRVVQVAAISSSLAGHWDGRMSGRIGSASDTMASERRDHRPEAAGRAALARRSGHGGRALSGPNRSLRASSLAGNSGQHLDIHFFTLRPPQARPALRTMSRGRSGLIKAIKEVC